MSDEPRAALRKRLFQEAIELPAGERHGWLLAACAGDGGLYEEVVSLLTAYGQVGGDGDASPFERPGTEVGRYRLQEELGSGRFGRVWRAEQREPVRRTVAVKILKVGMDTREVVARFERERQALACMDHPNVAKVLDGGATAEGRPFFVMELIEGEPITSYCDGAGATVDERLRTFLAVCRAVQHAHGKGVVHRDLKPENVLVTRRDGAAHPVVIDFGIAKAIEGELAERTLCTQEGQLIGTPAYMSPEQARTPAIDLDARTDVYSLAVLLYELLAGVRPFEAAEPGQGGYLELLRRVQDEDAPSPSASFGSLPPAQAASIAKARRTLPRVLRARLSGDLDAVLGKALERDRERRYDSCSAFAADLERHLRHESVLATTPTWTHRARKYVRRHRLGVAVVASLCAGTAVSAAGWLEATRQAEAAQLAANEQEKQRILAETQEQVARSEAEKSRRVLDLVHRMLGSADPHEGKPRDYTVRQLLDDFDGELGDDLDGQPEVERAIRRMLGASYLGLGLAEKAAPHFERAHELATATSGAESAEAAEALVDLANVRHDRDDFTGAAELARTALGILRARDAEESSAAAMAHRAAADNLMHLGRHDEANVHAEAALELHRRGFGNPDSTGSAFVHLLGQIAFDEGRHDVAVRWFREALQLRRSIHAEAANLPTTMYMLGMALQRVGKLEESEEMHRRALEAGIAQLGPDHNAVATYRYGLATTLASQKRFEAAETAYREALAAKRAKLGTDCHDAGAILHALGDMYLTQGNLVEAETVLAEAIAIATKHKGGAHEHVLRSRNRRAVVLMELGRHDQSEAEFRDLVATVRGRVDHLSSGIRSNFASLLARVGRHDEAERIHRNALAELLPVLGEDHPEIATCRHNLAEALAKLGRNEEAEAMHRETLVHRRKNLGAEHPDVSHSCYCLASLCLNSARLDEAESLARESLMIRREAFPPPSKWVGESLQQLANVLVRRAAEPGQVRAGRLAEAAKAVREAVAVQTEAYGEGHDVVLALRLEQLQLELDAGDLAAAAATAAGLETAARRRAPDQKFANVLAGLCRLLLGQERWADAEARAREYVDVQTKVNEKHPRRSEAQGFLGEALAGQGRFEEAEKALHESIELARTAHVSWLRAAQRRLLRYHESRGQTEEAEKVRQQLEANPGPAR